MSHRDAVAQEFLLSYLRNATNRPRIKPLHIGRWEGLCAFGSLYSIRATMVALLEVEVVKHGVTYRDK